MGPEAPPVLLNRFPQPELSGLEGMGVDGRQGVQRRAPRISTKSGRKGNSQNHFIFGVVGKFGDAQVFENSLDIEVMRGNPQKDL